MSKALKWILGILIGIIVVGALVAVGFAFYTHWFGMDGRVVTHMVTPWGDERIQPWRDMPMHPYGRLPNVRVYRFSPLAFIAGGLLRLGLLALVVLGIIFLVRSLWRPGQAGVTPAQVIEVPQQQETPSAAPTPAACPNCGFTVQAGWKHCPNCAHELAE